MRYLTATLILLSALFVTSGSVLAAEKDPCAPRVPAGELEKFKAMAPPAPETPETIQKGKAIYTGKGNCVTCHGAEGKGNGPLAKTLSPSPRNFTNPKFAQCKTAGEMFWAVRNGIQGTGMIAAVNNGLISEEEAWQAVLYERSFGKK